MQTVTETLVTAGLLGIFATTAAAQEVVAPASMLDRVTVTAGADLAGAYLFRGIFQEDSGVIIPPFVDIGVSVYEGTGAVSSVKVNAGIWNSLHSGPSGSGVDGRGPWYEADYFAAVTLGVGKWAPGAIYTSYTSPNDVFHTVHEIAAVLSYDDSAHAFPLNPRLTVASELKGQADGGGGRADGGSKGTYVELGIRPVLPLVRHSRYPVTLAIPAKLGISLKDYYEGPAASSRFGFVSLGGVASVPLAFMSGRTTWEAHGGLDVLWLGASNRSLNGGGRIKPIGVVGLSVSY